MDMDQPDKSVSKSQQRKIKKRETRNARKENLKAKQLHEQELSGKLI